MQQKKKTDISKQHASFLSYLSAIGNIAFAFSLVINYTGRAAWLAVGLGVLVMVPFTLWFLYLGKKYPGLTIFNIMEITLGRYICRIMTAVYVLVVTTAAIASLNIYTQIVRTVLLEFTSTWVIMAFLVFISIAMTSSGIRKMAELSLLLLIGAFLSVYGNFPIIFKNFKIEYIFPVFDVSFSKFTQGFLITEGFSAECLLFMMVMLGSIPKPEEYYSSVTKGILIWAVGCTIAMFLAIGVSSSEILGRSAYWGLSYARPIHIGEFIRGLEIFVLPAYQIDIVIKISYHLYSIQTSVMSLFNKKMPKILLTLAALLIFVPSVWLNSLNRVYIPFILWLSYITLAFSIAVLLLASIGVMLKKKKRGGIPV